MPNSAALGTVTTVPADTKDVQGASGLQQVGTDCL